MEDLIYAPPIPAGAVNEPLLHNHLAADLDDRVAGAPTGKAMVPVVPDGAATFMLKGR